MENFILYSRGYDFHDNSIQEERANVCQEVSQFIKGKGAGLPEEERLRTVLFLDEANTSEAIGLIKEIMIDGRLDGKPLRFDKYGIDVIAACNPYRK